MRKRVAMLLVLLLLTAALPLAQADQKDAAAPMIALTHVPGYGESDAFRGVVYCGDGSSFDADAYRVTLYLQVAPGDRYWVKPTADEPTVKLDKAGGFSIAYDTGGDDSKAQYLCILLIPASYVPQVNDFAEAKAASVDMVEIRRTPEGTISVEPNREAPDEQSGKASHLKVSAHSICVNVGFYTDGSQPGSKLSEGEIRTRLEAIKPFADTVRFFGAGGELTKAYKIAHGMGFKIVGTAWISEDEKANSEEMDALIALANKGYLSIAVVGSETLLRGEQSVEQLTEKMEYVRNKIKNKSIPVTTADTLGYLADRKDLRQACDLLFVNEYPYWRGVAADKAAAALANAVKQLKAAAGNKEVILSETGWPTQGGSEGNARAGGEEAGRYFEDVRAWSQKTGTVVFYFEAIDEPWKAKDEGEVGAHWGLLAQDLSIKDCYRDIDFFASAFAQPDETYVRTVAVVKGKKLKLPVYTGSQGEWRSEDDTIAQIISKKQKKKTRWSVKGLEPGETQLVYSVSSGTSAAQGKAIEPGDEVRLTVCVREKGQVVTKVTVKPKQIKMTQDETLALTASVRPANAPDAQLYWSSSNPRVADVDENGTVTALRPGKATITATAATLKSAKVKVTVK